MAGDVRGVWKSRFAGVGMCSAGHALVSRGAAARAMAQNKEGGDRVVILVHTNEREVCQEYLLYVKVRVECEDTPSSSGKSCVHGR